MLRIIHNTQCISFLCLLKTARFADADLAGANPEEHARAAMIGQCCEDTMKPLFPLRAETNDAKKVQDAAC